jgi:hypothetical protein
MAATAAHLERGYDKMFRWCSYEFRLVGRDTQLEVGATMREVVRRLRARPELLRWVFFQSPISNHQYPLTRLPAHHLHTTYHLQPQRSPLDPLPDPPIHPPQHLPRRSHTRLYPRIQHKHKRTRTPFSHGRKTQQYQQYRRWAPNRTARTRSTAVHR